MKQLIVSICAALLLGSVACERRTDRDRDDDDESTTTRAPRSGFNAMLHGSCEAACGEATLGCYCDSVCAQHGDCCGDFASTCADLVGGEGEGEPSEGEGEASEGEGEGEPAEGEGEVGEGEGEGEPQACSTHDDCPENHVCELSFTTFDYRCVEVCPPQPACPDGTLRDRDGDGCFDTCEPRDDPDEASCVGRCGERAPSGCYCDERCASSNDCCADRDEVCGEGPPPEAWTSCAGHCGESGPSGGCGCDTFCALLGSCCADREDVCSTATETSCVGRCGATGGGGVCACNDLCLIFGDCCEDYSETCSAAPPPQVTSCAGRCDEIGSTNACDCTEDVCWGGGSTCCADWQDQCT